jgi:predicted DNA-binding transcriptional regulator AlpA
MQSQARNVTSISELAPGDRRVLNENEVANRWGLSPKTLQRWRSEGRGPKYLKLSKRVGYPLESVLDFELRVLHDSTYQHATA